MEALSELPNSPDLSCCDGLLVVVGSTIGMDGSRSSCADLTASPIPYARRTSDSAFLQSSTSSIYSSCHLISLVSRGRQVNRAWILYAPTSSATRSSQRRWTSGLRSKLRRSMLYCHWLMVIPFSICLATWLHQFSQENSKPGQD